MKNNLRKGLGKMSSGALVTLFGLGGMFAFAALAISSVDTVADGVGQITEGVKIIVGKTAEAVTKEVTA